MAHAAIFAKSGLTGLVQMKKKPASKIRNPPKPIIYSLKLLYGAVKTQLDRVHSLTRTPDASKIKRVGLEAPFFPERACCVYSSHGPSPCFSSTNLYYSQFYATTCSNNVLPHRKKKRARVARAEHYHLSSRANQVLCPSHPRPTTATIHRPHKSARQKATSSPDAQIGR